MTGGRHLRACVVATWLAAVAPAFAAHPFLTEDPGTQGTGRLELELGIAGGSADPANGGSAVIFSPQLSVGVTPTLDVIAQGVWSRQSQPDGPTLFGNGDVLADVKWRFFERDGVAFGVRAGLDLPAGDVDTGLGSGGLGAHVLGIVGVTGDAWALYANAGFARARGSGTRANLGFFSAALTFTDGAPWQPFVEVATYSNPAPDPRRWPAVARTGFVYTVTGWLDVDMGFQARLNPSAPRAVLLAGATVRW